MTTKVIMPQMGESIFEGTITKWLKKVGDSIQRDEPLFEISTDKVDSEIPSPASGVVSEILVGEGQTVQINTVVAVIQGAAEPRPAPPAAPETREEAQPAAAPKPAPPASSSERRARAEEPTPPAAPASGPPPEPHMEPAPKAAPPARPPQEVRASPLVRRLAREHGIDLTDLGGTGLGGRITKQDVLSHLDQRAAPAGVPEEAAPAPAAGPLHAPSRPAAPAPEPLPAPPQPAPAAAGGPEGEVTPMSTMRRAIAEHMVASRRTSAHVTTVFEVDMSAIVGLRERMKAPFDEREGIKLTLTPFLARGLIQTAREFPILNASVSGDSIVTRRAVHLGVAVALEGGLIVPVVRDAHLRSFTGLALAIHDLAERARTKKLKPDEVTGGTITITNPGVFGGLFATPIINQPQVAILGVGGLEKRPVVVNDAIAIRPMMYLALSFDHRVIDGAVADQAMARLKAILTSWSEWID